MKKRLSIFDGSNKFLLSGWQIIRLFQSLVGLKPFCFTYLILIIILTLQNKLSRLLFTFNENELKIFCYIHWRHANANTLWLQKQTSAAVVKMIFLKDNFLKIGTCEGVFFAEKLLSLQFSMDYPCKYFKRNIIAF